jgi:GntR family transcriptional regulator, transcriptional repressor for pyruvate dehydrogenase complex
VFSILRDQLLEGAIRNGDRLLPERELALQLGVSRPFVREARRALSMMGVAEIRERVGMCWPDVSVLGDVFAFSLAQVSDAIDDVMQARIALECQANRLACQRATTADIDRLREALDAIEATLSCGLQSAALSVQAASFSMSGASSGFCSSPKPGASLGRTRAFRIWHCFE